MADKTPNRPPKKRKKVDKVTVPTIKLETASVKKPRKKEERKK